MQNRKDERIQIALSAEDKERAQELADMFAGGNLSVLFRRFIVGATSDPEGASALLMPRKPIKHGAPSAYRLTGAGSSSG